MDFAEASPNVDALLQMHQDAFDLVTDGVLWVDEVGRIQHCNESAATSLGYSRNALLKVSYFEVNPHFSMLGWRRFWNRLRENNIERLDSEFVNRAGRLFSIRGRAGFDLYSLEPELCIVQFQATEKDRRDTDLLAAVERDAGIGTWEVNLTSNQVYISTLVRQWLHLPVERQAYSTEEFMDLLSRRVVSDKYELTRRAYKALREKADVNEHELPLYQQDPEVTERELTKYILRATSVANELDVYKIYGTICPSDGTKQRVVVQSLDEELLKLALDRQPHAVYVVAYEDRRIVYANDRAVELSGYTKPELIGMPATQLADKAHQIELEQTYDKLRERKYLELITDNVRKDGTRMPALSKLYYSEQQGQEFLFSFTDDHSLQASLTEDIQLYASTLDALNEWVIWLNADNEVVLLNEVARRKFRRKTSQTIEGMPIENVMPDLEIPTLADVRQEKIDGRRRSSIDYIYTNASGEDRTLQVRFRQVSAGAQYFLCLICRDVTTQYKDRRRLQETKRRVDDLTRQLQSENETLREQIERVNTGGSIITVSSKYRKILSQIAQVADTDATVLVTGETGTGKELLAQSLHRFSKRGEKALVSVNCAALPENLIESELFGHERGAFTGAFARKKGKFELADQSTIFLDEIGELPLDMQAKLLRVLQEGEIQRIGSTEMLNVDVRVVAATNRNLERMIGEGRFREDLFYRLNVFPIHNPPLRERKEDIPVLVKHFAKVYADRMGRNITHINPRDIEQLESYEFPGNVRELINLVERAVITSRSTTLNLADSLRSLRRSNQQHEGLSLKNGQIIPFEEMQKQYIIEALKRTKGKVTGPGGAAELLQLNGRTLMSKMNKLGINRNKFVE